MAVEELFNFKQVLTALKVHDWNSEPYATLAGLPESGKTRLSGEYIRTIKSQGLVVHFDCRRQLTDDEIVQRAIAGADAKEFRSSRDYLANGGSGRVMVSGNYNNSVVKISQRGSFRGIFGRRAAHPPDRRSSTLSFLINDLNSISRPTWIVVDHADEAAPDLAAFVDDVLPGLAGNGAKYLLRIQRHSHDGSFQAAPPVANGIPPAVFRVESLTAEALQRWADRMGLELTDREAELVHGISGGRAGKFWKDMVQLKISRW